MSPVSLKSVGSEQGAPLNYNLSGWKIEEREDDADDACSARKCRETGKKDEEGGGKNCGPYIICWEPQRVFIQGIK